VESVAWISEQTNTLSTVFYLLSALAYLRFDRREEGAWRWYGLALGLFMLAILSKSVTATLPAALLVLAWCRRGRLSWRSDVLPLSPWIAVGLASGLFTAWVERTTIIGAEADAFGLTSLQRCLLAGRAAWFYLGSLLWPGRLNFIYPRWRIDPSEAWQFAFPLAALALLAVLWRLAARNRAPLAAALFFIGTLFPALGFLDAYPFKFSYVADHFQYLASLGIVALAAGAWGRMARVRGSFILALAVLAGLGVLTWRQCLIYRDAETLYRATIRGNPDCFLARNNLGKLLRESGRADEAIAQYREALRIRPDAEVDYNLGVALLSSGRISDAAASFGEALRLRPGYPEAHINLARALAGMGRFDEAIAHDEEALRLRPAPSEGRQPDETALRLNAAAAHNNLGNIFAAQGRLDEAASQFRSALDALPDYAMARNGLGAVLSRSGKAPEAIAAFEQALHSRPDYVEARVNLAIALAMQGRLAEAIPQFEEALRLRPDMPVVHFNLANALAQAGRTEEAAVHYREALRLRPDFPQARAGLARLQAK
jgi:tetratricopeptide (TPR) repeat protein